MDFANDASERLFAFDFFTIKTPVFPTLRSRMIRFAFYFPRFVFTGKVHALEAIAWRLSFSKVGNIASLWRGFSHPVDPVILSKILSPSRFARTFPIRETQCRSACPAIALTSADGHPVLFFAGKINAMGNCTPRLLWYS